MWRVGTTFDPDSPRGTIRAYTAPTNEDIFSTQYAVPLTSQEAWLGSMGATAAPWALAVTSTPCQTSEETPTHV